MVRHLDDSAQVTGYQGQGITVVKGHAAFTGPRTVTVNDRELTADNVIIATGSEPIVPSIDGLATCRSGPTAKQPPSPTSPAEP